jgi:hypothetical protein
MSLQISWRGLRCIETVSFFQDLLHFLQTLPVGNIERDDFAFILIPVHRLRTTAGHSGRSLVTQLSGLRSTVEAINSGRTKVEMLLDETWIGAQRKRPNFGRVVELRRLGEVVFAQPT